MESTKSIQTLSNEYEKKISNNVAYVIGEVVTNPHFSHSYFGWVYYSFYVEVKRLSGFTDRIHVCASHNLLSSCRIGNVIAISGRLSTYFNMNGTPRFSIFINAYDITKMDNSIEHQNIVLCSGFIEKIGDVRTTIISKRKISDLKVCINKGSYNKCRIPCVAWGENAYNVQKYKCGDAVEIVGRLQGREYSKGESPDTYLFHELSIESIEKI